MSKLNSTSATLVADRIALHPIPFGLTSEYGVLYGWNMRERLHPQEPETVAFFKKKIKSGDCVADIGANIGYYALFFSSLVGPNGKVVSFEPSPTAYHYLVRATKKYPNIRTENMGVFSRNDTLTLYAARRGDPMGSFTYKRGSITNQIPVIPLRDYSQHFDLAKIDVEGAELDVLRGLEKPIPAVLEVAKGIIKEQHGGIDKFFEQIEVLGYRIYFIIDNGDIIPYSKENLPRLKDNIYIEPTFQSPA